MKGKTGTSMQGIEYRPQKKGVYCKECSHLKYRGGACPYYCDIAPQKKKGRYYTSIVKCNHFDEQKSKKTIIRRKTMSKDIGVGIVGCEDCEFFIRGECIMQDEEIKPCQCGSWGDDA